MLESFKNPLKGFKYLKYRNQMNAPSKQVEPAGVSNFRHVWDAPQLLQNFEAADNLAPHFVQNLKPLEFTTTWAVDVGDLLPAVLLSTP